MKENPDLKKQLAAFQKENDFLIKRKTEYHQHKRGKENVAFILQLL